MRQTEKFEKLIQQTDSQIETFQSNFSSQKETVHVFWNLLKSYYFLFIGQVGKLCFGNFFDEYLLVNQNEIKPFWYATLLLFFLNLGLGHYAKEIFPKSI